LRDDSNPYAPPKAQEAPPQPTLRSKVPASAGNIELRRKVREPPVCLKCGATERIERREETFRWSVRRRRSSGLWYALLGPLGGLGAMVLHKDNDRAATLQVPLCKACNSRWALAKRLSTGAWVGALLVYLFARHIDPVSFVVLLLTMIGAIALLSFDLGRRALRPLYIDEETVVLAGSTPLAVQRLAEARADEKAKAKAKKGKAKARHLLREPDALEDHIGYEASRENTRSLDSVAPDERDAGR
jgi:ribosomal protein L37AE/L43A